MAHRLLESELPETTVKKTRFRLKWPSLEGKYGLSLFVGGKEIFLGIALADVIKEEVVRKRYVKPQKGKVKVFSFTP